MLVHGICSRCGYLTFIRISVRGRMARKECTCCGRGYFLPWDEKQKEVLDHFELRFNEMMESHPALRKLRSPGDRVMPPEEERPSRH